MASVLPAPEFQRFAGKRALLYGRVSTVVQESDGYSLDSQRRRGRQVAAEARMRVVGEDFEQGSGQDWDLTGVRNALGRAKRSEIDVLVLKNVSRLSRRRGKQAWIEHLLDEAQVEILYYDESYEDSATGRLQRSIMADIAEFQLEQARELSMEARYDKVEQHGRPVGNGQAPYGWRRIWDTSGSRPRTVGYEHDPAEAAVIRRFRDLLTMSTQDLCDQFNAEGIASPGKWRPTEARPRSGRWTYSAIWHILNSRMTWGDYRYGGRQLIKQNGKGRVIPKPGAVVRTLEFPPILTKAEVDEIKAALSSRRNARRTVRGTDDDPYILRGLLTCGHCGSTLATRSPGKDEPWRLYGCLRTIKAYAKREGKPGCNLPWLIAVRSPHRGKTDGIEEIAWQFTVDDVLDVDRLRAAIQRSREGEDDEALHAERLAFHRQQIAKRTSALERATMQWSEAEDDDDRASFGKTRENLKRELRSLRAELNQLEAYVPTGISVDEEEALLTLAVESHEDLKNADLPLKRATLRRLRFRGVVWSAPETGDCPDGMIRHQIGKHRFDIRWGGVYEPENVTGNGVQYFVNFRMESPVNGGPPVARLSRFGEGLSDDPLEFKDGYITLPKKPGLGMDMNEDALRANAYQHFPQRNIRQYADEP